MPAFSSTLSGGAKHFSRHSIRKARGFRHVMSFISLQSGRSRLIAIRMPGSFATCLRMTRSRQRLSQFRRLTVSRHRRDRRIPNLVGRGTRGRGHAAKAFRRFKARCQKLFEVEIFNRIEYRWFRRTGRFFPDAALEVSCKETVIATRIIGECLRVTLETQGWQRKGPHGKAATAPRPRNTRFQRRGGVFRPRGMRRLSNCPSSLPHTNQIKFVKF